MFDPEFIKHKIENLLQYLEELKPFMNLPLREVLQKIYILRTLERNTQLMVDTAVDINTHILLEKGGVVPKKNVESFLLLNKFRIFPVKFLNEITQSAGLRNRIVHEYEKVDPYILYRSVKKFHGLYHKYCRDLVRWLGKQR